MSISAAKFSAALFATHSPTKVRVAGPRTLGSTVGTTALNSVDVGHAFSVTGNAGSGYATLDSSAGTVSTGGTTAPIVAGGDGKDLEGVALGTFASTKGILVEAKSTNAAGVVVSYDSDGLGTWVAAGSMLAGGVFLLVLPYEFGGTIDWRIAVTGTDVAYCTILGASS